MIGDLGAIVHVDHPFALEHCEHQQVDAQHPTCGGNPLGVDLDHGIVTLPFGLAGPALPVEPPSSRPPGLTDDDPLDD